MLVLIVGLLIVSAAALYIASPLLGSAGGAPQPSHLGTEVELRRQRDTLLREIAELDLDFRQGKIEGDDYHGLREEYIAEAAAVLSLLDSLDSVPNDAISDPEVAVDAEIEAEIRRRRRLPPLIG